MAPKYSYYATEKFWKSFYELSPTQKQSVREAWKLFKKDPFDKRLRTHAIHRLSAHYRRTIYSVRIEDDLRLLFYVDGEKVVSLILGTHDVYK